MVARDPSVSSVDLPERPLIEETTADRTTVRMSDCHSNCTSNNYVDDRKSSLAVNLQATGTASFDVTRTPATANSPFQHRVLTQGATSNR